MKIFDAATIRKADELTIERQGITSLDLMERAANEVYLWLKNRFPDKETVFHVFCGKGNNGGDGLVVARLLKSEKYTLYLNIVGEGNPSSDFAANLEKINTEGIEYNKNVAISSFGKGKAVVIDALFGIGLSRELNDEYKAVIDTINKSGAFVVSIDVPSGMFMDKPTEFAIQADEVLTFQFPKLAFYLRDNYRFIKNITVIDIGLDKDYIAEAHSNYYLTDKFDAYHKCKPVSAYAHKGTQGHALIIGGSYGKAGAVNLAARAALKSGCGLFTAYVPGCAYIPLQASFPEGMVLTGGETYIEYIEFDLQPKAIGIGPGMGVHENTQQALQVFLNGVNVPLVIDADALNILAENPQWLELLPQRTIITPHPKELERLMGEWDNDFDKLEKLKAFASRYNIIVVAKDARTFIADGNSIHINATGNAALATGGSGDVLTGIITGLLAQGYDPLDAAVFGVYLHGLTADIGASELGMHAFTASSILDYIGRAYLQVQSDCM